MPAIKKVVFLLFLFISHGVAGQLASYHFAYGTPDNESADQFEITKDGGCIVAGQKMIPPFYNTFYGYLQKTDSSGNLVWAKTYTIAPNFYFSDCVETSDNGYMATGTTIDTLAKDIVLVKTDSAGNPLWAKTYGGPGREAASCILQTSDSNFIVLGETTGFGPAGPGNAYVFKVDRNGNVLWSRAFGNPGWENCRMIRQATGGGFFILGSTSSFADPVCDIWVTKISESGQLLWSKTFGRSSYDATMTGINTQDGGLLIAGKTFSYDTTTESIQLIRLDNYGDTIWTSVFKTPGSIGFLMWDVKQVQNGHFIITGHLQSTPGFYDGYLLNIDPSGNFYWAQSFSDTEFLYEVRETSGGSLLLLGNDGGAIGSGNNDVLLIKTDANGVSGCFQTSEFPVRENSFPVVADVQPQIDSGCVVANIGVSVMNDPSIKSTGCATFTAISNTAIEQIISISPNPSAGEFQINLAAGEKTIVIINVLGEIISEQKTNESGIALSIAQSGTYYVRVFMKGSATTGKIIVVQD